MNEVEAYRGMRDDGWPRVDGFIGREKELQAARRRLARRGVLILTGAPGSGKSALAARLGADYTDAPRIWIDCEDVAPDLINIAWLIADRLQDENLRRFLESDRRRPYPDVVRVESIIQAITRQCSLLCFDHVYPRLTPPGIRGLLRELARRASPDKAEVWLIVTAVEPPPFLAEFGYLTLRGIEPAATPRLFERRNLLPAEDLAEEAHTDLGGLPRLLDLAAAATQERLVSPEQEDAGEIVPISREQAGYDALADERIAFDLRETVESLPAAERKVLLATALFDGPVEPEWIQAALAGEVEKDVNVRFALYHLQDRGLVISGAPAGRRVWLTPVMRAFCRDAMSPDLSRRLHRNLAHHFEYEGDVLAAVRHYMAAGELRKAAKFLVRYADYADRSDGGAGLAELIRQLLSPPLSRAVPSKTQEKLRALALQLM